jgi:predicted HTH transcriptional regulator
MPDLNRFLALRDRGTEDRFLEYKESAPWDTLKLKIAKTAMAMANLRDGGTIIIGIRRGQNGQYFPDGVKSDHVQTYDPDDVQALVNRYADPYVRLEVQTVKTDGKDFVEIRVYEFEEVPIVCKRNGDGIRQGAIYIRSARMPETCEVQSQTEMRELIEVATDKSVRRFLARARSAGIQTETREDSDDAAFEAQRKGF